MACRAVRDAWMRDSATPLDASPRPACCCCCCSSDGGGGGGGTCGGRAANVFRVRETIATPPGKRMRSCLAGGLLALARADVCCVAGRYWNDPSSFARFHRGDAVIRCCANVMRAQASLGRSSGLECGTRLGATLLRGLGQKSDCSERTKVETLACRLCHCRVFIFVHTYVSSGDCPPLRLSAENRKLPDVCLLCKRHHAVPPYRNEHVLTPDTHVTGLPRTCVLERVVIAIWKKEKKATGALFYLFWKLATMLMCSLCQSALRF